MEKLNESGQKKFFLVAFIGIILINVFIFKDLVHALIFAGIIAGSFYPMFHRLEKKFSTSISAMLSTLIIFIVFLVPLVYLFFQLSKETFWFYQYLKSPESMVYFKNLIEGNEYLAKALSMIDVKMSSDSMSQEVFTHLQSISGKVLGGLNKLVGDLISFVFQFLIMLMAIYGFFLKGADLKKFIFSMSPLPSEQEQRLLERFNQMNFVSLVCNGLGGVIQGGLAGIAMAFAGFDSVFMWTTLMVMLAFIPLIGISVVTIPAGIILYLKGHHTAAIAFIIYCSVVALVVENWFKPKFIGSKIQVDSILLLFYIIAGMGVFGMPGIFYGPLLCVILLTFFELFKENYSA